MKCKINHILTNYTLKILHIAVRDMAKVLKPQGLSIPPGCKGLHFMMRIMIENSPLITPFFSKTWIPYSDHVGSNLQLGPRKGERKYRYPLIKL